MQKPVILEVEVMMMMKETIEGEEEAD